MGGYLGEFGESGGGGAGRRAARKTGAGERKDGGSLPAAAVQAEIYPAGGGEGETGEGLEEDQGQGSEAGGEGQGVGGT